MEMWERRLKHERDCRDALVACGNPPPKEPDPPGSFYPVKVRTFDGKTFHSFISGRGHSSGDFEVCKCKSAF